MAHVTFYKLCHWLQYTYLLGWPSCHTANRETVRTQPCKRGVGSVTVTWILMEQWSSGLSNSTEHLQPISPYL